MTKRILYLAIILNSSMIFYSISMTTAIMNIFETIKLSGNPVFILLFIFPFGMHLALEAKIRRNNSETEEN